jgi:hypothetical protein
MVLINSLTIFAKQKHLKPDYFMSKTVKSFVYQLLSFAVLFIGFQLLIAKYTPITGFWIQLTAFVIGTLLAPKFQAIKTKDGEKLYMKWIFVKGIREIN